MSIWLHDNKNDNDSDNDDDNDDVDDDDNDNSNDKNERRNVSMKLIYAKSWKGGGAYIIKQNMPMLTCVFSCLLNASKFYQLTVSFTISLL